MKETKFGVGGYPLVCKKAPLLPFSRVRYHGVAISYAISWKDRWRKSSVMWKKKKEEEKKLNLKFFSRLIIKIELWHSFFFFFSINTQPFRFFPFPFYNAFRTEREREKEREKIRNWNCLSLKNTHGSYYSALTGPITGESNQIPILCRKIDARRNKFPNGKAEEAHYWGRSLDKVK